MTDTTIIETEILKKAESLNIEIYAMFCKLARYKDKLTEPIYRYMADKLYLLYREEFERMTERYLIEREQKKYEYKKCRGKLVPRESWLFHRKNRAAKHFIKAVALDSEKFFSEFEAKRLAAPKKPNEHATPATCPRTGVNDLSEVAAVPESLPITTLQACDELVNYARMEEGLPPPQNHPKQGESGEDHKSDEIHKAPKTGKEKKE